ncbi:hypothetical protein ACQCVK_02890 [Rossellomorea vietnamensis]|uniref:hypothetical protein n=1 Tax=Rossellomorea vietnamensis TaxID=218284 RepID=UPI003CECC8B9
MYDYKQVQAAAHAVKTKVSNGEAITKEELESVRLAAQLNSTPTNIAAYAVAKGYVTKESHEKDKDK